MDAFIMAGGRGTRLERYIDRCEKPLLPLAGRPMITYSIDALKETREIGQIYIITSPNTPETARWTEEHHPEIEVIRTPGNGYVQDMITAVRETKVKGALLMVMSDLPLITSELLKQIIHAYYEAGMDALSVHIPLETCKRLGTEPETVFHKDGRLIVPVGINILKTEKIEIEQEDYNFILDESNVVLNVNTPKDYHICERILRIKKS
ncbi:Adenosylcobinamide-phosphate guanylyltransferase [Candidatus Methanoperedenaceae archaeon GB50]|nr:Adenosylcobinamide-phosphate guanylyltransferase [Candidatus Methanoperedenaceae archaeon GB50]CAD7779418.1 MAG: Adenosylcobinamide-phosphate guanylyltransferase [Candidatus Methanoperedenaceae archaeon GB50]